MTQLTTGEKIKMLARDESDDLAFFDAFYVRSGSSRGPFCHDFLQKFSLRYLIFHLWLNVCFLLLEQRLPFIKIEVQSEL